MLRLPELLPYTPAQFAFQPTLLTDKMRGVLFKYLWSAWLYVPTPLRYLTYKALRAFTRKLLNRRDAGPNVSRLPFNLYLKDHRDGKPKEVYATQFVAQQTTIPVPTMLDVIIYSNIESTFILMTGMPGKPLENLGFFLKISPENRQKFEDTLRDWLNQLRSLRPPESQGSMVCGFGGTSFRSFRITEDKDIGPYPSVDAFHKALYSYVPLQYHEGLQALAKSKRSETYRVCFTQGDLHPSNIIVDDNGVPTGLIDFGCAAWLPEYWPYTQAIYMRFQEDWYRMLRRIFPEFERELEVEMEFWKVHFPW